MSGQKSVCFQTFIKQFLIYLLPYSTSYLNVDKLGKIIIKKSNILFTL
jgi:hypothetical protein